MAKDLTKLALDNLKPGATRRETPDGHTRGLFYVLQPSGKASWALRYRIGGRNRKLTLGPHPEIDVKAARELARQALTKIAAGGDPAAEKQAAKAIRRIPADDLVEAVAEQFIIRHIRATMRPSWAREAERMVRKEIVSAWGKRRLSEIRKADIHKLLDAITDRPAPVAANRTLATFRRMCSWAIGRGVIEISPCDRIAAPAPERSRDRVLDDAELRALWSAAEALGWPFGALTQLLVLTGQRLGEIAGASWAEIDFAARVWTLPAERSKNGRAHQVPLSPHALAILDSLPRIAGERGLVFSTNGKTPVSGFSKAKKALDAKLPPDMPQWWLHDIRRSTATGLARLGVNIPVNEKILNHVSGSFAGIVGVYQRHGFDDEKRAALELWGRHVAALAGGPESNVVELAARR